MSENLGRGVNAELAWGLRSQQFALALNVGREKAQNVWVVLKTIKSDRDFLTCEQAFEYRDEVGMRKTYLLREPGSQYTVEVSGADKMFSDCLEYWLRLIVQGNARSWNGHRYLTIEYTDRHILLHESRQKR